MQLFWLTAFCWFTKPLNQSTNNITCKLIDRLRLPNFKSDNFDFRSYGKASLHIELENSERFKNVYRFATVWCVSPCSLTYTCEIGTENISAQNLRNALTNFSFFQFEVWTEWTRHLKNEQSWERDYRMCWSKWSISLHSLRFLIRHVLAVYGR